VNTYAGWLETRTAERARLPRLRPCGFHSPYEAAAWSVLAQRLRIARAARLRTEMITCYGKDGAFPHRLRLVALRNPVGNHAEEL